VIKDGNAHGLVVDRSVVVDPRGDLCPRRRVDLAVAVDDLPALLGIDRKRLGHADAKRAFLVVAEGNRLVEGLDRDVEVDPAGIAAEDGSAEIVRALEEALKETATPRFSA